MKVITLLIDTLRYDFMGFNGATGIHTPNFDRLAAKSVTFDKAYLGSYPCMPARRDVHTGKYEFPFRGWGPLEYHDKGLAEVITRDNGITSMLITDHYHLWEEGSGNYHFEFSGHSFVRGQEWDRYRVEPDDSVDAEQYLTEKQGAHLAPGALAQNLMNIAGREVERDYFPAQVMSQAIDFVEKNQNRDDFFLFIDCFDPHEPFDPPQHYIDYYSRDYRGQDVFWPTYGKNRLDEDETQRVRARYAAELTMVDAWVGQLLDALEKLQIMDDTMIVLTTDHGHLFGEHGLMGKPWAAISDSNMYEEIAHIPLVIYHPGITEPGRRDDHMVQLVDLYPTILDAFGIKPPILPDGASLLPFVIRPDAAKPIREVSCYGRFGESLNITDGEWTLFIWPATDNNGPLNWYSLFPPQFGMGQVQVSGDIHNGVWSVSSPRGPMRTALFNIADDPGQQHDRLADEPAVVARLKRQAADFLKRHDAPSEQFVRLGLNP